MRFFYKEEKYSKNYAEENITAIFNLLNRGNCLTIAAPSGFGKSNILRYLTFNPYSIQQIRQRDEYFIYIDLTALFNKDIASLSNLIAFTLIEQLLSKSLISDEIYESLNQKISTSTLPQQNINIIGQIFESTEENLYFYIILDNFDTLLKDTDANVFNFLRFLRDRFSSKVSYIFSIGDFNLLSSINKTNTGALYDLLTQRNYFLKLFNQSDLKDSINIYRTKSKINKNIDIEQLSRLSGGLASYIKYFTSLPNTKLSDELTPELEILSQNLLNSLDNDQKNVMLNLINNCDVDSNDNNLKILESSKLIKKMKSGYSLFSPIFEKYLRKNTLQLLSADDSLKIFESKLTKNEFKVFKVLEENLGELVEKEELGKAIWGNYIDQKYSNWAIDQVVTRLRKKLESSNIEFKLISKKGRGLILSY